MYTQVAQVCSGHSEEPAVPHRGGVEVTLKAVGCFDHILRTDFPGSVDAFHCENFDSSLSSPDLGGELCSGVAFVLTNRTATSRDLPEFRECSKT